MKNKFLLWFWILFPLLAFSQGENDNWYFGNNANINFAGTTPTVVNNSVMNAPAACGSISDSQGNLLFYTNGMTIWDRDHNIMLNGSGLTGTANSAQLLIMPDLVNADRYYVFTTADSYNNLSYTAYSIVDMTLGSLGSNGQPLGGVDSTKKNIPILDDAGNLITTGAVSVMPHANGSDFWILIPTHKKVLSFLFDSWGLSTIPVVSSPIPFPPTSSAKIFSLKVSPTLNYTTGFDHFLVIGFGSLLQQNQLEVCAFNSTTGAYITNSSLGFGWAHAQNKTLEPEFNDNGTILYVGTDNGGDYTLYKHNFITNNMIQPPAIVSSVINYGQIQRNQRGDIYFTINNGEILGNSFLGQILNPNSFTSSVGDPTNLFLNGRNASKGLPQLIPQHTHLNQPSCENDIHLTSIENNTNYTYRASNSITMDTNYILSGKNIVMKAGDNILMLPNTYINSGSEYAAIIENCPYSKPFKRDWTPPASKQIFIIGENNKEIDAGKISAYPNPTLSQFTIDIENDKLDKWELFDLSGKSVSKGNTIIGSIENLSYGTYILKIHLKDNKTSTIKLIKK